MVRNTVSGHKNRFSTSKFYCVTLNTRSITITSAEIILRCRTPGPGFFIFISGAAHDRNRSLPQCHALRRSAKITSRFSLERCILCSERQQACCLASRKNEQTKKTVQIYNDREKERAKLTPQRRTHDLGGLKGLSLEGTPVRRGSLWAFCKQKVFSSAAAWETWGEARI